jgi:Icc-related predicted phosphoesterase
MKIAWTTDIHLDHTDVRERKEFFSELRNSDAEGIIIAGDISGGPSLNRWLHVVRREAQVPVWFVLGNHDYYHSSIGFVREQVRSFTDDSLIWLGDCIGCDSRTEGNVILLSDNTALIGQDGWYDMRCGKVDNTVMLNDFVYIDDINMRLKGLKSFPVEKVKELANAEILAMLEALNEALALRDNVIVVTHVPPFPDAAWHKGATSEDNFLPFFSCKIMGYVLKLKMSSFPTKRMTVLCGHSHGEGVINPLPNLEVITGGAEYGYPKLCGMIEV